MEDIQSFKIKTEIFEGPLELLLSLIEKRKLFINDISLAKVADDYISYVQTLQSFPIASTAHFILIASTLLLIKSKSLLPSISLTEEESESMEDLERRLKLYKRYKELSFHVASLFGKKIIFLKNPQKNIPIIFSPDESMNISAIHEAIRRVIESLPKKELLPKVMVQKIVSLEEMIVRLTERMQTSLKMNFGEFAKTQGQTSNSGSRHKTSKEDKVHIIVSFLAMLELVKQGIIEASQSNINEDIEIETSNLGVPNYHS